MSYIADRDLFTDESRTLLLEAGDPRTYWTLVAKGSELPDDVARKYGLLSSDTGDASQGYAIRRYTVTTNDQVSVRVPINCNVIGLRNAGQVEVFYRTSHRDDAFDSIGVNAQNIIGAPAAMSSTPRFTKDTVLLFLSIADDAPQSGEIRAQFVL